MTELQKQKELIKDIRQRGFNAGAAPNAITLQEKILYQNLGVWTEFKKGYKAGQAKFNERTFGTAEIL